MQQDYDLLIVGGGLAGNCLALALKDTGLRMAIVEANTRQQLHASPAGDRALALAGGTVKMLEALGIWPGISSGRHGDKKHPYFRSRPFWQNPAVGSQRKCSGAGLRDYRAGH